MKKLLIIGIIAVLILTSVFVTAGYMPRVSSSQVPLPQDLINLPTIKAEPWLEIENNPNTFLEGPCFDRQGNLYVSSMEDGRIFKISPDKQVTTIYNESGVMPDGMAISKNGKLFVACVSGQLLEMDLDGNDVTQITVKYDNTYPQSLNDLVFDPDGNLYVTDFTGTVADPTGGVYRYNWNGESFTSVSRVLYPLASANGVSFEPGNPNVLWVSETCRNAVLNIQLQPDGVTPVPVAGVTIPFYSTGGPGGTDSNRLDVDGNLYQCIIFQGRAVILNSHGIPIANVIIPGREDGNHLGTTNLAFIPGTDEAIITAWGAGGAWLYKFRALAKGQTLYSHQ